MLTVDLNLEVVTFFGAPDGGVRIPNPARKLRHIPHPAEFFCPIPYPAGCSLFSYCIFLQLFIFSLRNNTSKMPSSIVRRISQIYGRLFFKYVTDKLKLPWLTMRINFWYYGNKAIILRIVFCVDSLIFLNNIWERTIKLNCDVLLQVICA